VNCQSLDEEGRVHAIDQACVTPRHRWLLDGKLPANVLIDAQAFRIVDNRTIVVLEKRQSPS
jgi:hypothetical protein